MKGHRCVDKMDLLSSKKWCGSALGSLFEGAGKNL
jgi:hypothetical protein